MAARQARALSLSEAMLTGAWKGRAAGGGPWPLPLGGTTVLMGTTPTSTPIVAMSAGQGGSTGAQRAV